ncbi:MAG TPA: ribbon-helix-helix protein, CopG family [Methylocaldum sp.]|nr:ribbon-helix-helix protein, CopG family [Methylocaldum sp.]
MLKVLTSSVYMKILENRTARLTLLIDPDKKATFERLCADEDVTPSQMVRKLIRDYIEQRMGPDWKEHVFKDRQVEL